MNIQEDILRYRTLSSELESIKVRLTHTFEAAARAHNPNFSGLAKFSLSGNTVIVRGHHYQQFGDETEYIILNAETLLPA